MKNSVVAESNRGARPTGRARQVSDRQREFRWTFQPTRLGTDKGARPDGGDLCCRTNQACVARDRDDASQMVMQGTTLVARIASAMLVLTIMTGVMMVRVIAVAFGKVGSNIPLALEGMLDMDADQRHHAGSLGPQKQPQQQRAKAPQSSQ
jgi:hypothetical protein